jgi:hypothetical protein
MAEACFSIFTPSETPLYLILSADAVLWSQLAFT